MISIHLIGLKSQSLYNSVSSNGARGESILKIKDWMSHPVITVHEKETVLEAAKLMAKHKIGSLVIVQDHAPMGIITERDVINKVIGVGKDPSKVLVEDVMSKGVTTVDTQATLLQISQIMKNNKYRRVVIVEGDAVVGIITARDILAMISS